MSAFSKILGAAKARSPRRVLTVPPSAFADTWTRRPSGPVKVGLRLISEAELAVAQGAAWEAARAAVPRGEDVGLRVEAHQDNLITNVLAQVLVAPDDISKQYFAPAPELLIREALNAGGIRHLWAAYEALALGDGELAPEASAEEMASLGASVGAALAVVPGHSAVRLRRLARAMLDEIAVHAAAPAAHVAPAVKAA